MEQHNSKISEKMKIERKNSKTKKKFVKPELKKHEELPKITTAFIGTYVP